MPELYDGIQQVNGDQNYGFGIKEDPHSQKMDPTNLLAKIYTVSYNPLVEKLRFSTMEGHLEVPNDEATVPEIENAWKRLYFRVKDARFQWFAVSDK